MENEELLSITTISQENIMFNPSASYIDLINKVFISILLGVGLLLTSCGGSSVSTVPPGNVTFSVETPNEESATYTNPPILNPNINLIGATMAYKRNYFGQNATIAFISEGVINTSHRAFADRIVSATLVVPETPSSVRPSLSPTAVAGIAAGTIISGRQYGIAPHAKIMPVRLPSDAVSDLNIYTALTLAGNDANIINYQLDKQMIATVSLQHEANSYAKWITPLYSELLSLSDPTDRGRFSFQSTIFGFAVSQNDVVVVSDTGGNSFNSNVNLTVSFNLTVSTNSSVSVTQSVIVFTESEFLMSTTIHGLEYESVSVVLSTGIQTQEIFKNGKNGVSGLFQNSPFLNPNLRSRFLLVADVNSNSVLNDNSNGCGASKNWCLAAPSAAGDIPTDTGTVGNTRSTANRKIAAGVVSGALALLKSRLPDMPMTAIRVLLLGTTTDIGAPGVDNIYGHGLVNVAKAITVQGALEIAVSATTFVPNTTSSSFLLSQSAIELSPAFRSLGYQGEGISIAINLIDNYHFDMPFKSVLKGNASQSNQLGFGLLAREDMSTNKHTLGSFGLRTNSQGNLLDFDVKHKQAQLKYAFCASGCRGSVWDEYKLDSEPLPFFTDTERKLGSGWKMNNRIGAFVVLGLDEDNSYDKYSQYGINWTGINLGNWQFAGSFSSIQEQQGYVLGSKFSGAYSVGETSSKQINLRAQRYVEGWRVFGGVEYGKTQVDTLHYSSVQAIDDVSYAGWRLGLDKDSVLRGNDKIRFGLTKLPSVISGNMELVLSQTTGDTAFNEDLQLNYLNKTEFRKHNVDLKSSNAFVYRLGYSTPIHNQQQLAVGLEHYADDLENDKTGFSVQYGFNF